MENSARKYVKEVKAIVSETMQLISHEDILRMDEREFKLVKMMFELLDTSCNIIVDQADQMDRMETKIDRITEIVKTQA